MVIPGSGFPSSAIGRVPRPARIFITACFRNVPNRFSDIQWGDISRAWHAYQFNRKTCFAQARAATLPACVSVFVFLWRKSAFSAQRQCDNNSIDNLGPSIAASIPLVVTTQSKAFKNPEAWAWNFTFEREMFWHTLLSVGYVARRGVHLQREADINQPTTAVAAAHPCLVAKPPCSIDAFSRIRVLAPFGKR